MTKRKSGKRVPEKASLENWVSVLARQSTETTFNSKDDRIEKRAAKKRRREDRRAVKTDGDTDRPTKNKEHSSVDPVELYKAGTEKRLLSLADRMKDSIDAYLEVYGSSRAHMYKPTPVKARTGKRNWDEASIQPRNRDYGGIGLARASQFLDFNDPSFFPKLEEEFAEHIPGFFGKQRTKAMKKQLAGKMLWRQLADEKMKDKKINGKKLSAMSPDERVEAMIKAGMV